MSSRAETTVDDAAEYVVEGVAEGLPQEEGAAPGQEAEAGRLPWDRRVTVVEPRTGWLTIDLREIWTYRELAAILSWRDFKVRYKQTFIGVSWAIIQPLMTMVVFTIIFGKFAKFPSGDQAYPIFSYTGLLLWGYFAGALTRASGSIVSSINFITKVYFPRVLLPVAAVTSPIADFFFASVVLFGLMAYYSVWPSWTILFSPLFFVLALVTALGVGLWFAAVNVRYRDVPYALPFLVQLWFWLSPVAYSMNGLPERWQYIISLNPMTGTITGFRWAVVGTAAPTPGQLAISVAAAGVFLVAGLMLFRRSEPRFADTI